LTLTVDSAATNEPLNIIYIKFSLQSVRPECTHFLYMANHFISADMLFKQDNKLWFE